MAEMSRRSFLKAVGAGLTVGGLWIPTQPETLLAERENDVRMRVLQQAILAPSSHNAQPWSIELTQNGFRLYADRSRLLPATDPWARQTHVSQGTFLELAQIAARQFGYAAEVRDFPLGEYAGDKLEDRPVAELALHPAAAAPQPLFAAIAQRETNKRPFQAHRAIPAADLHAIASAAQQNGVSWRQTASETERAAVAEICGQAMQAETASRERNRETAAWFRFSEAELVAKRDGFGMAQSGAQGIERWLAERFVLSRERATDPQGAFARGAVKQAAEQAASAPVFAALVTPANTRRDQIAAGRAYVRVQLAATRQQVAMQPLSQPLEEYKEMAELHQRLKRILRAAENETVQMLFRLGYAPQVQHSPRRNVEALFRQQPGRNERMGSYRG